MQSSPQVFDSHKKTEFINAIKANNFKKAQRLIAEYKISKAELDQFSIVNHEPLIHYAVRNDNILLIDFLAKNGANLNTLFHNCTAAFVAARYNSIKILDILRKYQADLSKANPESGEGPIHIAAYRGYIPVIDLLLKSKVNINQVDNLGTTAVQSAIDNNQIETIKYLASRGADLYYAMNDGSSPATNAASRGLLDVLKTLLDAKIDLTQSTVDGSCPLEAARDRHPEIEKFLLSLYEKNRCPLPPKKIFFQDAIISMVKEANYPFDSGGICFGLMLSGVNSFFVDHFETLFLRLRKIQDLTESKTFLSELEKAKNNAKREVKEIKSIQIETKQSLETKSKSENEILTSLLPFLYNITVLHNPKLLKSMLNMRSLYQTNANLILPLVASIELEKKGGIVGLSGWTFIYSKETLNQLINLITYHCQKTQIDDIAFEFSDYTHATSILFDNRNNQWWFLDANQLPPKKLNISQLVHFAQSAFSSRQGQQTLCHLRPMCTGKQQNTALKLIDDLKNSHEFKELHKITPEIVNQQVDTNHSILSLATREEDIVTLKALAKNSSTNWNMLNGINNSTALHIASFYGHSELTTFLADKINLDLRDKNGMAAIHHAANEGHADIVRILAESKADLTTISDSGLTAINYALNNNYLDIVFELSKQGLNLNEVNHNGTPLINYAISTNLFSLLTIMCESKVDLNRRRDFYTPLTLAIKNKNTEMIKYLIKQGADINVTGYFNDTPLQVAIYHQDMENIQLLIELKADIKKITESKDSAFSTAIEFGSMEAVQLLLKHEPKLINHHSAEKLNKLLTFCLERTRLDQAKLLIDSGIQLISSDNQLIHKSVIDNNFKLVSFLIQHGANLNIPNTEGNTTLYEATKQGNIPLIKLLAENKADINKGNTNDGWAPIHIAAQSGNLDVLGTLIEYKAKIDNKNTNGASAVHVAVCNNKNDVLRLLAKYNANLILETNRGSSPACLGVLLDILDSVKTLHELKVDLTIPTSNGKSLLELATRKNAEFLYKLTHTEYLGSSLKTEYLSIFLQNISQLQKSHQPAKIAESYDIDPTASIIKQLANEDIISPDCWPGIYTTKALQNYLKLLKDKVPEYKQNVALLLSDPYASVILGFEARYNRWVYFDSKYQSHLLGDEEELASLIQRSFCWNGGISLLETQVLCYTTHKNITEKMLLDLKDSTQFKELHTITPEIAQMKTFRNTSLLHLAARHGHLNECKQLAECKAFIDLQERDGNLTPAFYASHAGHTSILQLLAEYKANFSLNASNTATIFYPAFLNRHFATIDYFAELKIMNLEMLSINNLTLLQYAIKNSFIPLVKTLVKCGVNLNIRNNAGTDDFPIHLAIKERQADILKILIENKADLSLRSASCNNTPLIQALNSDSKIRDIMLNAMNINFDSIAAIKELKKNHADSSRTLIRYVLYSDEILDALFHKINCLNDFKEFLEFFNPLQRSLIEFAIGKNYFDLIFDKINKLEDLATFFELLGDDKNLVFNSMMSNEKLLIRIFKNLNETDKTLLEKLSNSFNQTEPLLKAYCKYQNENAEVKISKHNQKLLDVSIFALSQAPRVKPVESKRRECVIL